MIKVTVKQEPVLVELNGQTTRRDNNMSVMKYVYIPYNKRADDYDFTAATYTDDEDSLDNINGNWVWHRFVVEKVLPC